MTGLSMNIDGYVEIDISKSIISVDYNITEAINPVKCSE